MTSTCGTSPVVDLMSGACSTETEAATMLSALASFLSTVPGLTQQQIDAVIASMAAGISGNGQAAGPTGQNIIREKNEIEVYRIDSQAGISFSLRANAGLVSHADVTASTWHTLRGDITLGPASQ